MAVAGSARSSAARGPCPGPAVGGAACSSCSGVSPAFRSVQRRLRCFNTTLRFTGSAGRNAFANLNPCFYHLLEPVIYSALLTCRSGQARHRSSYLPAAHYCASTFCVRLPAAAENANVTITLCWVLMGWALNAGVFSKCNSSLHVLGGQTQLAEW